MKFKIKITSTISFRALLLLSLIFLTPLISAIRLGDDYFWKIEKTGNEENFDVYLSSQKVDVSDLWTKILSFFGLSEKEYEDWLAVQICSPDVSEKKLLIEKGSIYVLDKNDILSKEKAKYRIYSVMPVKTEKTTIKTLSYTIEEKGKEKRYCYYDLINPKERDFIKYGEESIIITKVYNFTAEATLNQTQANANFVHLEVNNSTSPYDKLMFYLPFDGDNNISLFDISKNRFSGVYYLGAYSTNNGIYGNALNLDGIDDYIRIPRNTSLQLQEFSYSVWIYPLPFTGKYASASVIQHQGNGYNRGWRILFYNTSRAIAYQWGNGTANIGALLSSCIAEHNKWTMITITRNASGYLNFYVNGTACSGGYALNLGYGSSPAFATEIGSGSGTSYFKGRQDEVMFFDRALTQAEIQAIYNNQSSRFKHNGSVIFPTIQLNETKNSFVNWKINASSLMNTKIYGSLGECNNQTATCSNNTGNYTFGDEVEFINGEANFTISINTTNLMPKLRLESPNGFYSPYVFRQMTLELSDALPPRWLINPNSLSLVYGESESLEEEFLAYDEFGIEEYATNDTRFYFVDNILKTNEKLAYGNYSVLISVKDTNNNYNYTEFKLIIEKRNLTIRADNKTKVYSTSDPTLTYAIIDGNLVYGDVLQGNIGREEGEGVGTYNILQNTLTDNGNYTINFINGVFTITKATPNLNLISNVGWNIMASTYATITGTGCPSQLICNLYQANEEVSNPYTNLFPAGIYVFLFNTSGNQNYTSFSITKNLISSITSEVISNETKYCPDTSFGYNYLNNKRMRVCQ